ncbi:hypothetical protein GCM10009827_110440 [Dactylosporangium maewongense]|uniref:Uncharacterized protein n=1 Tax=Dactylosporangium maewongense TaxID=634393 RepID=A0ABP4NYU5_9ACTN
MARLPCPGAITVTGRVSDGRRYRLEARPLLNRQLWLWEIGNRNQARFRNNPSRSNLHRCPGRRRTPGDRPSGPVTPGLRPAAAPWV